MKALRKKFILFAMTAVTFLLVILVVAIGCAAWFVTDRQSDAILETLLHSDGMFGRMDFEARPPFMQPLDMDRMKATRFFSVLIGNDGTATQINTDQIDAVNKEQAVQYAQAVLQENSTNGSVDGYKYAVKENETGKFIIFMDTSMQRGTLLALLITSCCIVAVCWGLVLLFVVLLSERVVRPVWQGMEKQKQFITNAGHELKTPLSVIQANNDAMALIHGENKYNINIRSQISRLSALTNTMLSLAKFEEQTELPTEEVNPEQLLREVVNEFSESMKSKHLKYSIDSDDSVLSTNKEAFCRLLTLLTDNAVKYTPEGGEIAFILSFKNSIKFTLYHPLFLD